MSRRSASRALVPSAPVLDPRTTADLASVGDRWLSAAACARFIDRALRQRSDPVFRLLENIAEVECGFPRLVSLNSGDDLREVGVCGLRDALRAAYEAGRDAGRREAGEGAALTE